ncbi:Gfo/Idh/MocA family protein [Bermanella sp. WJH001]|uniref:Gfo/Idh/MocA family protein n=1 Tax=Bermanella sp. WJH001 TaxID=3048005 RepID=UPI0024BD9C16|nr:Gfo/Idh/MocA family oxidoreductase [Bermanella sp. WJH001]MDJ1537761.1 Gfo/Idh/MocA family oxidoreductase [Bermanella sp. WJH001]
MKYIAVIGLGNIAKRHRENIRLRFPQATIYAVSSSGREINEPILNCDILCQSLTELISKPLDFAIVASPASYHAEHSLILINNGIPVLIEKPLTSTPETAEKIIQAHDRQASVVAVAYCLRYLPVLQKLKSIIEGNFLGRIYHVTVHVGQDLQDWRPGRDITETVSANAYLGGGVLNELSHEIDYMSWLFGELTLQGAILIQTGRWAVDVEDMADISLVSEQNIFIQMHLDFVQVVPQRYCQVISENGRLDVDLITQTILHNTKSGSQILYQGNVEGNDKYLNMLDDFIAKINGQKHNCISLNQAYRTVKLIAKIKENHNGNYHG